MSEISNITAKGMIPMIQSLIDNYKSKGMKASGEFEQSLEIKQIPNGAVILGAGHSLQLEVGRVPTSSSSSDGETLLEKIDKWIDDKGIYAEDISRESLIFLITRKIHEKGWDRSKYGGLNLISDSISDSDFQTIIDDVLAIEGKKLTENLIKILKG